MSSIDDSSYLSVLRYFPGALKIAWIKSCVPVEAFRLCVSCLDCDFLLIIQNTNSHYHSRLTALIKALITEVPCRVKLN